MVYCINKQYLPPMLAPTQTELILSSAPEPKPLTPVVPAETVRAAHVQDSAPVVDGAPPGVPPELLDTVWRANQLGGSRAGFVSTGFAALDAALVDGGWPLGGLIEILQPQPSLLEWRLVGPSLRPLVSGGRTVVVIGHPKRPNPDGLRHLGIEEDNLLWVKVDPPSQRLWATEQAIRSNAAAAILTWLPQARPEQLRRLQVLAQGCEGPVFIIRPVHARHDPSPAPLRVFASLQIDWQMRVEVFKRRGAPLEAPLTLPSIPGGLDHVLTRRMRRPSQLIALMEAQRALGRPRHLAHATARTAADSIARAASLA